MDITARTILRLFLLIGGVIVLVFGIIDESTLNIAVGLLAAILGAIGLWDQFGRDRSQSSQ